MTRLFFAFLLLLCIGSVSTIQSQTREQKDQYLSYYNQNALHQLFVEWSQYYQDDQRRIARLTQNNPSATLKFNEDGSFDEWVGFLPDGSPLYYALTNVNAARSTRANHLNSGGSLQLNLNGEGLTVGIWDGGPTRVTHVEFSGRAVVGDNAFNLNSNSFHATHVSGTVGASGVNPLAKGMAPNIQMRTFNWNNDITEVIQEVQNGMLLSNHSYGTPLNSVVQQPWFIGAYSQQARIWDQIAYAAPYYLMVASAGNDGNNTNPAPNTPGWDKLNGNKNSKNNLVIANAQDANVDEAGNLISVSINSGSSQGPSDDRRIKPDITGNGTGVFSTNSSNNTSYTTLSGTSMSGPNVMGTLALLQQYHQQRYGRFMRAATLKGLACHTADDAGLPGPDPVFGWGLLNAKAAANLITTDGLQSWISEEVLRQGETFTMTVNTLPNQPLLATICWTDVPGVANNGVLNDTTPALVNDLDIRITKDDEVFYPWRLLENPTQPAVRNGDNFVDNVEKVQVDFSQGGAYTITVTHKGTLVDSEQRFSLIISGLNNSFAVTSLGEVDKTVCSSENAVFDFNFTQAGGAPVNLSALNLPAGATASFSSPTLTSTGNFQMTLSNLNNVPGGIYSLQLEASNGIETISRTVVLRVFQENISPVTVISPTPYQTGLGSAVTLEWEADDNYEDFFVEVATDVAFNSVVFSQNTSQNQITVNNLNDQTVYYWRVMPTNRCSISSETTFYSFQTGVFTCQLLYEASDYSNAVIEEVAGATALIPITVTDDFAVGKVNVIVNISHTWVQDVTLYLQRDDLMLGFVTLVDQPCGSQDDIVATFDDFGAPLQCGNQPAISGNVIPLESLGQFNLQSAQGEWSLFVTDSYFEDGGQVNYFGLEFCGTSAVDNIPMFNAETIFTETNSIKTITIQEMNANTQLQSSLEQTYTLVSVPALGVLQKNGIPLGLGGQFSQQDIEQQLITYNNTLTAPAQDQFVVDIVNSSNGWLPQQTVEVVIQNTLSQTGFEKPSWVITPNPSRGTLTIQGGNFNEVQLQIFDLQGRLVFKTTAEKNKTVYLNGLQEGVYLVQIAEGNKVQMEKIVLKK